MPETPTDARELHLLARPSTGLVARHLVAVDVAVPRPMPGTVLVGTVYVTPDPSRVESGARSWPLRTALRAGPSVGRVLASRDVSLPVGALVRHDAGWSTHVLLSRGQNDLCPLGSSPVPPHARLGVLGQPGLLAYAGVRELARVAARETVFVAPAEGAFGAAAVRVARLCGAGRVIGGTSGRAAGADFDAVVDCRADDLAERLIEAAPQGVHAAVLGVAPEVLAAVLAVMAEHGRVAWTGDAGPGPRAEGRGTLRAAALVPVRRRGIQLIGYRAAHCQHLRERAESLLVPEYAEGRLATPAPVRCDLADLAGELAALADGSATGAAVYQMADL